MRRTAASRSNEYQAASSGIENSSGPHMPMPSCASMPVYPTDISIPLVTSARSALRPWVERWKRRARTDVQEVVDDDLGDARGGERPTSTTQRPSVTVHEVGDPVERAERGDAAPSGSR